MVMQSVLGERQWRINKAKITALNSIYMVDSATGGR
jgi:hypothetical protein